MPILKKEIVPVGRFLASTPDGNRVWQEFSKPFTTEMVNTSNAMLDAGLRIPAPFGHKKTALPEIIKNGGTPPPFDNAGYWIRFAIEPNDEGVEKMYGYIDTPGSDTDSNSPYYKAKNTAKEVSLSFKEQYQDGLGRNWKNGIMHVALVNHPIAPSQEEFKDIPDGSLIVNMSMMENDDTQLINQLRDEFNSTLELNLPSPSNVSQFLRDLLVAVLQLKKPKDTFPLNIAPIYMSQLGEDMNLTLAQAQGLVATKAVNPVTNQPYTLTDFGFQVTPNNVNVEQLQMSIAEKDKVIEKQNSLLKALQATLKKGVVDGVTKRLNALKEAKKITDDQLKGQFTPMLEFEMSINSDGTIAPHPLEMTLSALEAIKTSTTVATNPREGNPADGPVNIDELMKQLGN